MYVLNSFKTQSEKLTSDSRRFIRMSRLIVSNAAVRSNRKRIATLLASEFNLRSLAILVRTVGIGSRQEVAELHLVTVLLRSGHVTQVTSLIDAIVL